MEQSSPQASVEHRKYLTLPKITKILILLILSILLFAGGLSFLLFRNQQKQSYALNMQNWKTYTNVIMGYSLKYPSELSPHENLTTYESVDFMPNGQTINDVVKKNLYMISVYSRQLDSPMSIGEFWYQQIKKGLIQGQTLTRTTVAGADAIEVFGTRGDAQDKTIFFITNGWVISLQLSFFSPTYAEGKKRYPFAEEYLQQIAKTFTFLPQSQGKFFQSSPKTYETMTDSPDTPSTTEWNEYINRSLGFKIKYPNRIKGYEGAWEYKEDTSSSDPFLSVGFRPKSLSYDNLWGIFVYKNSSIDKLIDEVGVQFNDRIVHKEQITINGNKALLVTVTVKSEPSWVMKKIYLEKNNLIFVFDNGAIDIPEFQTFYQSFQWMNEK